MPKSTTSSSPAAEPLSFTVCYGLLGGHSLGRRLRRLMRKRGYRFHSLKRASDIVIAHSAGCFHIPTTFDPKLVAFVGMPISLDQPRQTFRQATRSNMKHFVKNRHAHRLIHIFTAAIYYGLRHPKRNLNIIRQITLLVPGLHPDCQYLFIAGRDDPWQRSPDIEGYIEKHDWTFISLPGSHDDIWDHPEEYVAIIDQYAKLLAQTDR